MPGPVSEMYHAKDLVLETPTTALCPFCRQDPFEYVHNGVGMEPVAVTCCELGIMLLDDRSAPAARQMIDWQSRAYALLAGCVEYDSWSPALFYGGVAGGGMTTLLEDT